MSPSTVQASHEWDVVSLATHHLEEPIDLDELLRARGVLLQDVPFIGRREYRQSCDLVVRWPFLDSLRAKLHDFVIEECYDPAYPTEGEVRVHGLAEALRRTRIDFLNIATTAATHSWGSSPSWCYRDIARAHALTAKLERSILSGDVLVSVLVSPAGVFR